MDCAVAQRLGKGFVHEPVLLQQRQAGEARARDRHLKMVAAAGAVLDAELGRIGERLLQQHLQRFGRHAAMVAVRIEVMCEATATELALAAYRATMRSVTRTAIPVLEGWRRKDELAEYSSPRELAGSEIPFAWYSLLADL
jgi:hypothetical protein